uniref:C3H1-type domain-containing protein n=1 Tax=Plectus sambesii TaxID=2011161 RepID=A0A914XD30_9BILA
MPPKTSAPSKKTEMKKKEKIVEDKTFGLKNKKGAKTQKFVQTVVNQVKNDGKSKTLLDAQKHKKPEEDDLKDLNKLLRPVTEMPKIAKDVDPKSVLCLFFKQGMCHKGNKCKFSHDLAIENKSVKRNLYVDSRDIGKEGEAENMDDWDETKLKEVAETKHGEEDRKRANQTDIVCKYFLDAVENSKYGWFWECPNGSKCIYRHALPPGFVLKRDRKLMEDLKKEEQISLDELIEKERAALSSKNLTKVTLESFIAWKKRKIRERKAKVEAEEQRKRNNYKTGKQNGLSGRDLFTFNPDMVGEDDDDADDLRYEPERDENEPEVAAFEIDERTFYAIDEEGHMLDDDIDMEEAAGGAPETAAPSASNAAAVEFNEDLFDADDLPDSDSEDSDDEQKRPAEGVANLRINGDG